MSSSSKLFPIDNMELSPYVLPMKRRSKPMNFNADTPSIAKLSFDSGIGSCDFSDEEEMFKPVDNVFMDCPTPLTSLHLSWMDDDNLDKINSPQISRLGFKTRKHAQRTNMTRNKFVMSPSPTACMTGMTSMRSLMSPSPIAPQEDFSSINSIMSPSSADDKIDIRCKRSIMPPSPDTLKTNIKRSKLKLSPSPVVVRKDRRNIRPIISRSPIDVRFNLNDSSADIESSCKHSVRKHVINQPRNERKCKRSTDLSLDSPEQSESEENDTAPYDVISKISVETFSYDANSSNNDVSSTELTGDFSRQLCLPVCSTKLSDLNAISPTTAMKVINGDYSHVIDQFITIDCRYPYEYEGGHIKDARNFSHVSECDEMFEKATLSQFSSQLNNTKRTVLIVHCEFSQMRGPTMARHLRNVDRTANGTSYPALHYPEIYVIEGGYKAFHTGYKEQCTPQDYIPMDHPSYSTELSFYRSKSTKEMKVSHRRATRVTSTKLSLGSPLDYNYLDEMNRKTIVY